MITPRFSCSQTKESVIISVYCPSIRASDVQVNVDNTLVSLHVNPYFLRLNFSYPLEEDDKSEATYNPSSGMITITLTKRTPGQEFKDLDLMAKLLAPRPSKSTPAIEVVGDDLAASVEVLNLDDEVLEGAKNDWQLPQQVPEPMSSLRTERVSRYGFLNRHSGYFEHVTYTENEVNELGGEAETLDALERRARRIKRENDKWDEEYYLADFADPEYIEGLVQWKNPLLSDSNAFEFTETEKMAMLDLPRVEFIPTPQDTRQLYLTLVTLLFSYAYDTRTTQHDPTPESAWTICSLTPAFTALDPPPYTYSDAALVAYKIIAPSDIAATLLPSYRRSLAFPLYRSFVLAERCKADVAVILSRGVRVVTRCLLELKDILDHHEVYYIYSKVWVTDFCIWIQAHATDEELGELGGTVGSTKMTKESIGWGIPDLERVVHQGEDRESDSDDETESDSQSDNSRNGT